MASTVDLTGRSAPVSSLPQQSATDRTRSPARRWVAAGLLLAAALSLSIALREFIPNTVFVFFFAVIPVTAWYSGLVPGLAITAVGLIAVNYLLIEPVGAIRVTTDTVVMFLSLGFTAGFINWLTNSLTKARAAAASYAEELEEQARELEAQMEESQMLTEELETTNADMHEALTQAEAGSRSKSEFLAVMSHELRTPLNAIVGYADLLQAGISGPLSDVQKTQLSRIRASSYHLLDLIQDVLSFSRIEAGREELRIGDVEVQHIARDAYTYVETHCIEKGLQPILELPAERVVMITDASKVRQILLNLLTNACKFTEQGTVTLRAVVDGLEVAFSVADTGPGIAPEHFQKIFEPFTQVDQSTTRQKGGVGLGLPVSRRLAHLLGGELTVSSNGGGGSTFTLRLPLQTRLK